MLKKEMFINIIENFSLLTPHIEERIEISISTNREGYTYIILKSNDDVLVLNDKEDTLIPEKVHTWLLCLTEESYIKSLHPIQQESIFNLINQINHSIDKQ